MRHEVGIEGGTGEVADGGQLGIVAEQEQAAALAAIDIAHKVVEQAAATEGRVIAGAGEHGRLIDNKEGTYMPVVGERERLDTQLVLAVDLLMDGIGGEARVAAEDLGGTAGGGEQDTGLFEAVERADECTHHARLAGAGIAAEDEGFSRHTGHDERPQGLKETLFLLVGLKRQFGLNASYNEVFQHFFCNLFAQFKKKQYLCSRF